MVRDPARQALGRLPQQRRAGAPEDEEAGRVAGTVHEDPQQAKESFVPLHLVNDHESAKGRQREFGIGQPPFVRGVLQIEGGDGSGCLGDQLACEGGLAHLAGPDDPDDRELVEKVPDLGLMARASDHGPMILEKRKRRLCFSSFKATPHRRG